MARSAMIPDKVRKTHDALAGATPPGKAPNKESLIKGSILSPTDRMAIRRAPKGKMYGDGGKCS